MKRIYNGFYEKHHIAVAALDRRHARAQRWRLAYLAALILAAAFAPVAIILATAPAPAAAICDTDEDCMRHCPPPMDDPDCDGGPQS